jgi:hypothetical protein
MDWIKAAQEQYGSDEVEIDSDALVSENEDEHGAWVAAWVWVEEADDAG